MKYIVTLFNGENTETFIASPDNVWLMVFMLARTADLFGSADAKLEVREHEDIDPLEDMVGFINAERRLIIEADGPNLLVQLRAHPMMDQLR
jgi:hypothetical protein